MQAKDVMDISAALVNDAGKQIHTYSVQLPYLKLAMRELKEIYQLHNIPITNETSDILVIPAGTTVVSRNSVPSLPLGLITIRNLFESETNQDKWTPVTKRTFLPKITNQGNIFSVYSWISDEIRLLPLSVPRDLKIDYIQSVFSPLVDENSQMTIETGISFLEYRNAALCAEFVSEDKPRAESLNNGAGLAIDRALGIEIKPGQTQGVRRRPFRSGYKLRR